MVTVPSNPNLLGDKGSRMVLTRIPDLVYYTQIIRVPSLRIGTTQQWSPMDQMPWPGDTLYRDDFTVRFKVNEDMTNYMAIWDWMVRSVAPDSPNQYKSLIAGARSQRASDLFSDVTVVIPNSAYGANVELRLQDAFPVSLDGFEFQTVGEEINFVDASVTFRFRHFTVHRVAV